MAEANKRKRDDGMASELSNTKQLMKKYAEILFYECMFSAQFTANIQILFRIEDIALKLPSDSFAANFSADKQNALEVITTAVNDWKRTLEPSLATFFDTNDLAKAVGVVAQKGVLNVSLPDKVLKLPVKDNAIACIMAAIDLLRYPLARMEHIQRGRSGSLLDLEKDAVFIMAVFDECETESSRLLNWLDLIAGKENSKKSVKTQKAKS